MLESKTPWQKPFSFHLRLLPAVVLAELLLRAFQKQLR